jgi:adenosylcobinamide-phosphate synthase
MGWIAIVITLLIEQFRALPARNPVYAGINAAIGSAERGLNAGEPRHGMYAWWLVIGVAALVTGGLYAFFAWLSWFAALAFSVLVLYFCLGFRQFSHRFSAIQLALDAGDIAAAQRELTAWKQRREPGFTAADLTPDEVVREAIEYGLLLAHRHVFGVFFWYLLLPGPIGPVVYRLADLLSRRWNERPADGLPADSFGRFALRAFAVIDWLPARLSALGFAIVGDFEGALYCWRRVAAHEERGRVPDSRAVLLAAAGGALGVRIMSSPQAARYFDEPGNEGAGLAEPSTRAVRSAVGMVWRAMLLWLGLLLLLTLAGWLG